VVYDLAGFPLGSDLPQDNGKKRMPQQQRAADITGVDVPVGHWVKKSRADNRATGTTILGLGLWLCLHRKVFPFLPADVTNSICTAVFCNCTRDAL